ncbi:YncE family protein, partial [candidate division WOR-3 bacterium]|nr:YncE family protein [candidate division WOR-3 bacterium]
MKNMKLCAILIFAFVTLTNAQWLETTIAVGDRPCALVYNPTHNKVYCANTWGNDITVIDGATNKVITTIGVGLYPYALVYNPTNNKVYCTNLFNDNVTVIDGATNGVITTITVGD